MNFQKIVVAGLPLDLSLVCLTRLDLFGHSGVEDEIYSSGPSLAQSRSRILSIIAIGVVVCGELFCSSLSGWWSSWCILQASSL